MRLTLHTDYSLRALMYAGVKQDGLATVGEIADHFGISRAHVRTVINRLGRLGYIETVRGRNGGFRLLRKPTQISVGAVVRDTEEELGVAGCLQGSNYCPIEDACILRRALQEATRAFLGVLDTYTLDDLLRPSKSLAKLLSIDWAPAAPARPAAMT